MVFVWGVLAVTAVGMVLGLVYRSARRRRERLVLAFTERIGLPVTPEIVDRIDRRIRDRFVGFALGGLTALLGIGVAILIAPQFIPTGLAGYAAGGVLTAAMAAGGAVSALRQFPPPGANDASRIARIDTPILQDYISSGWQWAAAAGMSLGVALSAGLLTGALPSNPGNAGLPFLGVLVLAGLSILGVIVAVVLSKELLAIPQPASTELELQWDDALRASALRDIWVASIGLATSTVVAASSWVLETSSPSIYATALVGTVPLILFSLPASKRSRQRLWPHSLVTD